MLTIANGATVAEIVPGRGGMVTRLAAGADEILYLDPATLATPKVRGGIPVLFPNPGPLADGRFEVDGRPYALGQHGFARERAWEVVRAETAEAELRLVSDASSLESFPFAFELRLLYRCSERGLRIETFWRNTGNRTMPIHFGLHPYFHVAAADKAALSISTDAKLAWDNDRKEEAPFRGFDLSGAEVDLHLLDHSPKGTTVGRPGKPPLRLSWGNAFHVLVVWTLPGKDFVCVEPWTARGNALNTRAGLIPVHPGEERASFFAVEVG